MIRVPRLKQNRHGVYSIRVLWTDEAGKRREALHSLRTKQPTVARLLALQFNEAFERKRAMTEMPSLPNLDEMVRKYELDIGRGIMKADSPADHALMLEAIKAYKELHGTFPPLQEAMQIGRNATTVTQANPPPRLPLKSMRFSEAIAAYMDEKKLDNNQNTRTAKSRTYADFKDLFGDLEINLLGKPELVQWKTHDMKRGITATRVNARLGQLNDLFAWAINNGHYTASDKSPVEGLRIGKKSKLAAKHESYEPFSNDELKAIFGADYLKKFDKPDFYWLPIVALFTGARREEIATLLAADVKAVDGVPCLFIQKGKTPDARRLVPLHPMLLSLGFMDYAQHVQSLGQECLFPYLVETANGKGKNAGRQFSNWLGDLGINDSRKVFHSFRHTLITRLHAIHSNPAHVMQITGHAHETQGVHFQTYTHDVGLMALAETLGKLVYPLDWVGLKLPDPTFKVFLNRWKMVEARKAKAIKAAENRKK